jgi:hypothetical protein
VVRVRRDGGRRRWSAGGVSIWLSPGSNARAPADFSKPSSQPATSILPFVSWRTTHLYLGQDDHSAIREAPLANAKNVRLTSALPEASRVSSCSKAPFSFTNKFLHSERPRYRTAAVRDAASSTDQRECDHAAWFLASDDVLSTLIKSTPHNHPV